MGWNTHIWYNYVYIKDIGASMAVKDEEYSYEPHHYVNSPILGKSFCIYCGLINVNNKFTQWAHDKGCLNRLHPSYNSARAKYTKLK